MIPGLPIEPLLTVHVALSLVGIVSGLVAMTVLTANKWWSGWQKIFLATTILTSVTGFLFPFSGVTPAFAFGVISIIVLAVSLAMWPRRNTSHMARVAYAISATFALYLNVFVLVVQAFQKFAVLQSLAPTQSEPAFVIAQAAVLIAAVVIGGFAVKSASSASAG